ncbi:MAG TPA: 50S ribosomal protein L37ae [Candidatus Nanoarchaeia archaeon]|nr:50S ribosomal protein L37ae [Candidatus Nanoarchaeia archaeon]
MGAKTKKIKAFGRFGAKAGTRVRARLNKVEGIQRRKQCCPYCNKFGVKRESSGIWHCAKCGKRFAGHAYMLNRQA